jgi:hypothetical protein
LVGNQRSSGYQNALSGAGSDFASRLAAMRAQHDVGQQSAELAHGNQGLTQMAQFQNLLAGQQNYGLKFGEQQQEFQRKLLSDLMGGLTDYSNLQSGNLKQGVDAAARGVNIGLGQQFESIFSPEQASAFQSWAKEFPEQATHLLEIIANLSSGGTAGPASGAVRGGIQGLAGLFKKQ